MFTPPPLPTPELERIVNDLIREGVAIATFQEVFGSRELYERAAAEAWAAYEAKGDRRQGVGAKSYLVKLFSGTLATDHVYGQIVLHPNALAVANAYMKMRTFLRAVDVWLTVSTEGPATETQLWHRDGDDLINVKMFVYFTNVTSKAGPFCYAPGTHPRGDRRTLPERDDHGRSTDAQLTSIVPKGEWIYCTGEPGMVVFADTCGYHKQVKPEGEERVLLVSQYTSGAPMCERSIEIDVRGDDGLSVDQRYALYETPT